MWRAALQVRVMNWGEEFKHCWIMDDHEQGPTKVMSDCSGLVNLSIGQANFSSHLPNGQAWLKFCTINSGLVQNSYSKWKSAGCPKTKSGYREPRQWMQMCVERKYFYLSLTYKLKLASLLVFCRLCCSKWWISVNLGDLDVVQRMFACVQLEHVMHGDRWFLLHIRVLRLSLMLRSMIFELRRGLLAVAILDGFSIELHQKKRQVFGFSDAKFESRPIWFTVWKSAWHRIGSINGSPRHC